MKNLVTAVALLLIGFAGAQAQIVTPQPSPTATLSQTVGLTEVEIVYSRPGLRDRQAFGKLVPYGQIWRTGANASTKISFSDPVMLGGQEIPAGTYALYTIPGEKEWTVIVHKNLTLWGEGGYDQAEDLVRFTVPATKVTDKVETFTMDLNNLNDNQANISLVCENTKVDIPLEVNYAEKVMASIDRTLAGPSANDYANAANFYLSQGKDLGEALAWITKAVEMRPEAFWYVHTQAKIHLAMGDKAKAKAAAEKSKEMASKAPNDFGYIANNNMLLEQIAND